MWHSLFKDLAHDNGRTFVHVTILMMGRNIYLYIAREDVMMHYMSRPEINGKGESNNCH